MIMFLKKRCNGKTTLFLLPGRVLYGHVEATAAKRTHYFPLISNW